MDIQCGVAVKKIALCFSISSGAFLPPCLLLTAFPLASLCAQTSDPENSEEALFARRIAEFWKDKDAALTKAQIEQFFQIYPSSSYRETLLILLGEIYQQEGNFGKALSCYNQLYTPHQKEKVLAARFECLYQLGMMQELRDELKAALPTGNASITDREKALKGFLYGELLLKEGKEELLNEARAIFTRLLQSEKKGQALLALGDIAFQQQSYEEAAKWYEEAAEFIPEKRDDLLLLTVQLLYQQGKYSELIERRSFFQQKLNEKANTYLGKAFFATGQNGEALFLLLPHIRDGDKQTQLTALSAAFQLGDFLLVDSIGREFLRSYPSDQATPRVLLLQGIALKKVRRYPEAETVLNTLLNEHPDSENREEASFELGVVYFEQSKWDQSHAQFSSFRQLYPNSLCTPYVLYYLPDAAWQGQQSFSALFDDIDRFMSLRESDQEKGLTLAKIAFGLYDQKKVEASKKVAQKILQLSPSNQLLAQVHFLLAVCALEQDRDGATFVKHGEQVLTLRPDFPGKERLREKLINYYLQEKEKSLAARHLYTALEEKENLSSDRILWLANYHYEKAQEKIPESFYGTVEDPNILQGIAMGIMAFEAILGSDPAIDPNTMGLEQDYFKLSNLYAWRGQHEAQVVLLQNLHEQQRKNPSWKWTLPTRTLTALAEGYRSLGDKEKALQAYGEIVQSRGADTASLYRAKLEWVRLHDYKGLTLDSPVTVELLKALKDLQIKKTVKYEPLHLEAALEYAQLRSALEPPEKQAEHYYFLIQRVKEDFTEKKDLISKEYHSERERSPGQNLIYQAYMLLIDANIFRFEGETDPLKKQTAASLYQSLIKGKFAVSKYLVDQAQSGLDSLK